MTDLNNKIDALCQQALQESDPDNHYFYIRDAWRLAHKYKWVSRNAREWGLDLIDAGADLESVLELVPPDCQWLMRSNSDEGEEGGFFANVWFPEHTPPVLLVTDEGCLMHDTTPRFKTYAKTPAMALLISCLQAWKVVHEAMQVKGDTKNA